ncbi:MAG: GNAT family N-acetyltransferase [Phycisphaerales bacterium]
MIHVIRADYDNPRHKDDIEAMLDAYARDPMGGGRPLPEDVMQRLVPGLKAHPASYTFLAYRGDPDNDGQVAGIANCFLGFSTFAGRPLINIHDLAVHHSARRMGVGRKLLDAVRDHAISLGCCGVTLEIRDDNTAAWKLYADYGFHDQGHPHRFWKLKLS